VNREIKFCGKRLDNGEWVYGGVVIADGYAAIVVYSDYHNWHDFVEVDPATVGQYTGLKDKNGVESYHKDIVRTNAGNVGVIEFGSYSPTGNEWDNAWGWFIQFPNGDQASMDEHFGYWGDEHFGYWGEVVGNVYKNPELLGEFKEV
jgi:uncharacterized phage protein (TIGR01671 family)